MSYVNGISFYGQTAESVGSIAKQRNLANLNNNVCDYESAGSIAHSSENTDIEQLKNYNDSISFGAHDCIVESQKEKNSTLKTLAYLSLLAIGVIGGLGYAHKSGTFEKLNEGWLKKTIGWLEPAGKTCRGWCSYVKTKGNNCIDWIKGLINKK